MSSFCQGCGNSLPEGERYCVVCGKDASADGSAPRVDPQVAFGLAPETSGKAIFSLVCGSLFIIFPLSPAAVIFGHLSLSDIRRSGGRLTGRGLAITGIVLGYVGVALFLFIIGLGIYGYRAQTKAIQANRKLPIRHSSNRSTWANDNSAVSAVRTLNTAEIAYAQAHRDDGYTCSISALSGVWGIDSDLASGKKNGYIFEVKNCQTRGDSRAITKYQLVAYPQQGKNALPAFCSDESDVIHFSRKGTAEDCLKAGLDLAENEMKHAQTSPQNPPR